MINKIKIIVFLTAAVVTFNKAGASAPEYTGDPDCLVSGIVKNIEFKAGERGEQYQKCLSPTPPYPECGWILDAGKDKYRITLQVSESSGQTGAHCANNYPLKEDRVFYVSADLFKQSQIKNGDTISGNVKPPSEFSDLHKKETTTSRDITHKLDLSISQKLQYFILEASTSILWAIVLIPIAVVIIFVVIKLKNNSTLININLKKIIFRIFLTFTGIMVLLASIMITLSLYHYYRPVTQNIPVDLSKKCISEPGKAYNPPTERCCNGLTSVFGEDSNVLLCYPLNKYLLGEPSCAPCGNGKCEKEYGENRCSCPKDCHWLYKLIK